MPFKNKVFIWQLFQIHIIVFYQPANLIRACPAQKERIRVLESCSLRKKGTPAGIMA